MHNILVMVIGTILGWLMIIPVILLWDPGLPSIWVVSMISAFVADTLYGDWI